TSNLGAGKGIDLREAACDSLIVVNNTFVNFQDRAIRHYNFANPQAGTGEIKYGLIDHNTFINGMGFHGLLSLGNVGAEIIITNNLFVDAFALGEDSTDATRAAEWANTGEIYPNGRNRITWIFTAPNTTTRWQVSNNYYTISDSGWAFLNNFGFPPGSPLSYHINSRLGADSVKAFTMVSLKLGNTPRLMTNMMRWYESPTGGNRTKNTPSAAFNRNTDDYDRRPIEYYRDELDATYDTSSPAFTGAQNGYPAGDLNWYPELKAKWEQGINLAVADRAHPAGATYELRQNYPNPFNPSTHLSFTLARAGEVKLEIYNALGRKIATLIHGRLPAGRHEYVWDARHVPSGIYFYKLQAGAFAQTRKMIVMK
ncbi:MAG: T9SS type A sorting domain-containing protein, partial [candidate division KSB1 bacterium]|nr:T9SS type A sorting domain-containing protein [candidate division KSB1 bacterium]